MKTKKSGNKHKLNKTKKHKILHERLTQSQKQIICKKYFNQFNTFEDKVEEMFKKSGIDFMSTNYDLEKQIIRDLKKAVSPSNISPKNDFYSYINERWLRSIKLDEEQKYIVQIDYFRLIQDKVYRELIEIIEQYISQNKGKKATCIKNMYESLKRFNTDQEYRKIAKDTLNMIDDLRKDKKNIWKLLGIINNNEIISWGSPFMWTLNPDDKNPTIYRCYVDSPKLSLIDLNVYFDDNTEVEYKNRYRKRYFQYLNDIFTHAFGENHGFRVKDIFDVEFKILMAMGCEMFKVPKDAGNYNIVTKEEATKKYNFDWTEFAKAIGFQKTPDFFITSNLNYLRCGSDMLMEEWDSEPWRTYFIYIFIRQQQRWTQKGRDIYFDFNGKYVRGQEQNESIELVPVFGMGFAFNTFLSNEYIDRYQNDQYIQYVNTLAQDLRTVFIRIIRRNKWLQPKTKEYALQKLENFNITIGSPKVLREDPLLDYDKEDAWGNMLKICQWRHNKAVNLEGGKVIDIPVMDWSLIPPKFIGTQAYVVNACYTPSKNEIYVPLGYIQKPFVDLDERGIEYNLAHIGFTLGHEMSHALDDWGSQYDHTGKLHNWWTEKDKKKFKAIQKDVIKQYEVFASYDGIDFDAEPSIGENLADIAGLTICREYLRDFQLKNNDILPIQNLSFEAFFVYFAFQQRQKISKKAIAAQLKTNPHPLDKYRTNVPLSRLPIFRAIFDIKKGDKMWWPSTNRIWEG